MDTFFPIKFFYFLFIFYLLYIYIYIYITMNQLMSICSMLNPILKIVKLIVGLELLWLNFK